MQAKGFFLYNLPFCLPHLPPPNKWGHFILCMCMPPIHTRQLALNKKTPVRNRTYVRYFRFFIPPLPSMDRGLRLTSKKKNGKELIFRYISVEIVTYVHSPWWTVKQPSVWKKKIIYDRWFLYKLFFDYFRRGGDRGLFFLLMSDYRREKFKKCDGLSKFSFVRSLHPYVHLRFKVNSTLPLPRLFYCFLLLCPFPFLNK